MTARKRRGAASTLHVKVVRDALRAHATRGTLRQFEERAGRGGKIEFAFTWLLDRRFTLVFDLRTARIVIKDLLPGIPARSHLDKSIREFVAARGARGLPPHRRIDPARLEVACVNRKSQMSFEFRVKRNQYAYAVPKVLNFCNELFGFLDMRHVQYLWERMGVPEE